MHNSFIAYKMWVLEYHKDLVYGWLYSLRFGDTVIGLPSTFSVQPILASRWIPRPSMYTDSGNHMSSRCDALWQYVTFYLEEIFSEDIAYAWEDRL